MIKTGTAIVICAALSLAACGNTKTERGLSGAGIGAGVGAATGVLTDKDDINLD